MVNCCSVFVAGLATVLAFVHSPIRGQPPAAPRDVVAIIDRGGCGNCNVIPGVPGADGEVGPDLSMLGKVAGTRKPKTTAKEYVRESILDPDAFVAPGGFEKGVLPKKFGKTLSQDDLNKLVDYLATLGVEASKGKDEPRPKLILTRPAEAVTKAFAPSPVEGVTDEQIVLGKGGVGPDKDVVAFNGLCPHMGWGHPGEEVLRRSGHRRPCPGHWTTFDLTRHGTVVSGHATHGDDVIAVEFEKHLGQPLIFGFYDNKTDTKA